MQRYANMYKKVLTLARTHLLPPSKKPGERQKSKQERAPGGRERGAGAIQPTSFVGKGGVRGGGEGGKTIGENLALLENQNVH